MSVYMTETNSSIDRLLRKEIIKSFLERTGLGITGTITSGATTGEFIDDVMLRSKGYNSNTFVGWVRVAYDQAGSGAAPQGEIKSILSFDPSQGLITTDGVFSSTLATDDEYEIWHMPHPRIVLDRLDDILKNDIYIPYTSFLSYVNDFDMENSTTSEWSLSGAGTLSKVSTINDSRQLGNGTRVLLWEAAAAETLTQASNISVVPDKHYHASCYIRAGEEGGIIFRVRDTDSNEILESATLTSNVPTRLWFTFQAGTSTKNVRLEWYTADEQDIYIDDVVFYPTGSSELMLPKFIRNTGQVEAIYRLAPQTLATSSEWSVSFTGYEDNKWNIETAPDSGGLRLTTLQNTTIYPIWIHGTKNSSAYINDHEDRKPINLNLIVAMLASDTFDILSSYNNSGNLQRDWILERQKAWNKIAFDLKKKFAYEEERTKRSYPQYTYVYKNRTYNQYPVSFGR